MTHRARVGHALVPLLRMTHRPPVGHALVAHIEFYTYCQGHRQDKDFEHIGERDIALQGGSYHCWTVLFLRIQCNYPSLFFVTLVQRMSHCN